MTVDVRRSAAKNLCYGNRTVIPSMMNWSGLVRAVYIHGEHSQVFATMMGIQDAKNHYGDFGFPVEAVTSVTTPGPRFSDWASFLSNWYGIAKVNTQRELKQDDVLLILGVDESASSEAVRRAETLIGKTRLNGSRIFMILPPEGKLPQSLRPWSGSINGSNSSYLNPFAYPLIETAMYNRAPANIHIFGTGLSTVTTAIGALDFLARFAGDVPLSQLAKRVMVDETVPDDTDWGMPDNLEAALTAFQFPWTAANNANLALAPNKVQVTPYQ
jgi:hypothetical protein